jgi:hypothetical protein
MFVGMEDIALSLLTVPSSKEYTRSYRKRTEIRKNISFNLNILGAINK